MPIFLTGSPWDTQTLNPGAILAYQFVMDTSLMPNGFNFGISSSTVLYGSNPREAVISLCPGSMTPVTGTGPTPSLSGGTCWVRSSRETATIRFKNDGFSCPFVNGQTYYLNIRPAVTLSGTQQPVVSRIVLSQ